jgi:hypothetical protein
MSENIGNLSAIYRHNNGNIYAHAQPFCARPGCAHNAVNPNRIPIMPLSETSWPNFLKTTPPHWSALSDKNKI